jgi:hypothetical protein
VPGAGDGRVAIWLFVLAACVYCALARGYVDNMDSQIQFATARNVAEHGSWSLRGTEWESHRYAIRGPDGEPWMPYPPGTVLLHLPALLAGRLLGPLAGADPVKTAAFLTSMVCPLAAAATLALLYRIATALGLSRRDALVAAAVHGLGTYAFVYARSTYYETPAALAFVAAAASVLLGGGSARSLLLGGAAFAFAVSMKAAHLVVAPAFAALLVVRPARDTVRRWAIFFSPSVCVAAWLAWIAWARFGSPFSLGYGRYAGFGTPIPEGLARVLLSGRAGWFVFSPVLVLAVPGVVSLWRRSRPCAALVVLSVVAVALLSAGYDFPEGGTAYGARYLVPVTAGASLAAAVFLADARRAAVRVAAFSLLAVSVAVQLPLCVIAHQDYWQVHDAHTEEEQRSLPPPVVADAILAWEKLRGRDHPYDLSCLGVAAPGRTLMPVYPALPGPNVWWARAAVNYGRNWAPLGLIPLAAGAAFAANRLRAALRNS